MRTGTASSLSLIACLLLASCAADPASEERPRGQLGKADLAGSCQDSSCDGPSPDGTCFCDDECESWGDCCADWSSVCQPVEPAACASEEFALCPDGFGCVLDDTFGGEARDWPYMELDRELRFECQRWSNVEYCCDPAGNLHPACAAANGPIRIAGMGGELRLEVFPRGLAFLFDASLVIPDEFTIPVTDHEVGVSALIRIRLDKDAPVWIGMNLRRDPADKDRMVLKTDEKVLLLGGSVSGSEVLSSQAFPFGYLSDTLNQSLELPQLEDNIEACAR